MEKIKALWNKYKEIILYLFFGIITTVVSLGACFATLKIGVVFLNDGAGNPTPLLDVIGSSVQWVVGVLVAFITNKLWVFTDSEKGFKNTAKQLGKFTAGRIFTYFLEVVANLAVIALFDGLGYRAFTLIGISVTSRVWAKAITSVIVVVTNYILSKLLVFKKSK